MSLIKNSPIDSVTRISTLDLKCGDARWTYAAHHREEIEVHWRHATAANPAFFNGVIHVIDELELRGEHCEARLLSTDFKSFLYWRDAGFPSEAQVLDGFGSALIRSADGQILLGRQRPGNINAGLAYLPGGFIDDRDIGPGGIVELGASVAREVKEETGLDVGNHSVADLQLEPGYLLTRTASQVSIAAVYRSALGAQPLVERVAEHIAKEVDPELSEMVPVSRSDDLHKIAMPHYARVLLSNPLAWSTATET